MPSARDGNGVGARRIVLRRVLRAGVAAARRMVFRVPVTRRPRERIRLVLGE